MRPLPLAVLLTAQLLASQDTVSPADRLPGDRRAGASSVSVELLQEWLGTLASEEFGGRGTGQPGYRLAADYLAEHFENLGLEPAGTEGSWFQDVPWMLETVDAGRSGIELLVDEESVADIPGEALHGALGTGLEVAGHLAVVATDSYDGADLAGLALDDRVTLVVARAGLLQNPDDPRAQRFGPFLAARAVSAIGNAVRKAGGRLAAIIDDRGVELMGPFQPRSGPTARAGSRAAAGRGRTPTGIVLSIAQARALLAPLEAPEFDTLRADRPWTPNATLRARVVVAESQAPAHNVCAILRGTDPDLRDEYVVVGCHLDHLGAPGGVVHPGADDDGSGTTGLMAIAQAFARNPKRPRRSILFLAFCGEENGLIGSSFYTQNPTVPLESMVAELQIDMIGRNEEKAGETAAENVDCLHLVGSHKLSDDLHQLCVRLNDERAGFEFEWDEEGVFYRSDHWNFARVGVPIAFFFTGFHPDYHQPSDTPDKIDYPKLRRVLCYVYDLAFELAQADQRPQVDAERWDALERKARAAPAAPVRR